MYDTWEYGREAIEYFSNYREYIFSGMKIIGSIGLIHEIRKTTGYSENRKET